jgi:hypothetical protein
MSKAVSSASWSGKDVEATGLLSQPGASALCCVKDCACCWNIADTVLIIGCPKETPLDVLLACLKAGSSSQHLQYENALEEALEDTTRCHPFRFAIQAPKIDTDVQQTF